MLYGAVSFVKLRVRQMVFLYAASVVALCVSVVLCERNLSALRAQLICFACANDLFWVRK